MSLIDDKLQHEEECLFFQKNYGILNSTLYWNFASPWSALESHCWQVPNMRRGGMRGLVTCEQSHISVADIYLAYNPVCIWMQVCIVQLRIVDIYLASNPVYNCMQSCAIVNPWRLSSLQSCLHLNAVMCHSKQLHIPLLTLVWPAVA